MEKGTFILLLFSGAFMCLLQDKGVSCNCGDVDEIEFGVISYHPAGLAPHPEGSNATVACNIYYQVAPHGFQQLTCVNGSWQTDARAWPECQHVLVFGGYRYIFYHGDDGVARTFAQTREHCQSLGGDVPVITSQEQNEFLAQRLRDRNNFGGNYWIGLEDIDENGEYTWIDRTVPGYTADNWNIAGSPGYRCGLITSISGFSLGSWRRLDCSSIRRHICQIPIVVFGGYRYIFYHGDDGVARTFAQTREHCQSLGGDVPVITSQEQNEFLAQRLRGGGNYWIGLEDIDRNGEYTWIDRTVPGYTADNWNIAGSPGYRCGLITSISGFPLGSWRRLDCSSIRRHICQIPIAYEECGEAGTVLASTIEGGVRAESGAWPWQAALYDSTTNDIRCGGSLIKKKWILTAAHCFRGLTSLTKNTTEVYLGLTDRTSDGTRAQVFDVSKLIMHPQYEYVDNAHHNDIALLRLDREAHLNSFVRTVCLPPSSITDPFKANWYLKPGKRMAKVTGWGHIEILGPDEQNYTSSKDLLEVDLPLVGDDACQELMRDVGISVNTTTEFCAGNEQGHRDSYVGDPGGPLVVERSGIYKQVGIINSYGYGSYTRLPHFVDWVEETIAENTVD